MLTRGFQDEVVRAAKNRAHSLTPAHAVLQVAHHMLALPSNQAHLHQFLHQVLAPTCANLRPNVDFSSRVPVQAVAQLACPVIRHAPHRKPQHASPLRELWVLTQHVCVYLSYNERLVLVIGEKVHDRAATKGVESAWGFAVRAFLGGVGEAWSRLPKAWRDEASTRVLRPTRRIVSSLRAIRFSIVRMLRLRASAASRFDTRTLGTAACCIMRARISGSAHRAT